MSYDPGFDGVVGALPLNAPTAPTAVHRLQRSQLKLSQLEMMGQDIDLTNFHVSFNGSGFNMAGAMLDGTVERTVEGASTLTVTITDEEYALLSSGWLSDQLTVEIDGLFWMLATVKVSGPTVTLVFQEREIVVARRYDKPIKQSASTKRGKVTRAEFALRLLRGIKEFPPIPYVIPALKVPQPIGTNAAAVAHSQQRQHDKGFGIPRVNNLEVKKVKMTPEQRRNADTILTVGVSHVLPRKYLVASIMCTIQESSIINLRADQSPGGHVGCFQQDPRYWPASRDVAKDADAFFKKLAQVYSAHPSSNMATAVYLTQNPGNPKVNIPLYAQWQNEAERIVDEFGAVPGGPGSAAEANNTYNAGQGDVVYEFYRGRPPTSSYQKKHGDAKWGKENTWDCWQRLATEVQWRCFFISGTFYFISEDDLFKQRPIGVIDGETMYGVDNIDGTYDSQGKSSDLTVTVRMGRWAAPPGSVVKLKNLGLWDGRWLVNDVSRSLFNDVGTIVLKKPLPALPEPDSPNVSTANGTQNGKWSIGGKGTNGGPIGTRIVHIAKQAAAAPGAAQSYLFGGTPGIGKGTHTDCSGFVKAVYAKAGLVKTPKGKAFPRTSQLQYEEAPHHPKLDSLEPGDLLFFNYEGAHSHVGIYIGGNKSGTSGRYIGDQHTGSGIVYANIDYAHFDGAARYTRRAGGKTGPAPGLVGGRG